MGENRGGGSYEFLSSIQQTSDGGYIMGGSSFSGKGGEKTEFGRGRFDCWVVKLNRQGDIQWDKTIGGSNDDGLSIKQTRDGGYILGGNSYSDKSGEKTEDSRGENDYWVVKLNSSGNIQWDKTIGGNSGEGITSFQQTNDGGYLLGGASGSNKSFEKTEDSRGSSDYWVVKLDGTGKIQWDKTIGGSFSDYLYSIKEIGKERYVLGGTSNSEISGDKKKKSRGGYDFWLAALNAREQNNTIAVSQNSESIITSDKTFAVYPNPAKDILYVQNDNKTTFSLTNQAGKLLFTKTIANKGEINIAALPMGMYFLKNNETGVVKKVIVQK